jgi:transposase InsO family protein
MAVRREFVELFDQQGANRRELCRRFGIEPRIGYERWQRWRTEGEPGLANRSRRPHRSPHQTSSVMEAAVLAVRTEHPAWGGRKIHRRLQDLGQTEVPSPSTITAILKRHGRIDPAEGAKHKPWQRFERDAPNELWQMDVKGHFAIASGRCHPLTVIDDHSRYALGIVACGDEREPTVRTALTAIFRCYGLPDRILADNGAPWGGYADGGQRYSVLAVWLMQLGVGLGHGRPFHPQTQGKDERFHRTLNAEVIGRRAFRDLADCQRRFDAWRVIYNTERPHQALELSTPASRYKVSRRGFPEVLAAFDYGPGAIVRKADTNGDISFNNRRFSIGKAFRGHPVALRATAIDGEFEVRFHAHTIAVLSLREPVAPVGPQGPPGRAAASELEGSQRRARVPPVDYRDDLDPAR